MLGARCKIPVLLVAILGISCLPAWSQEEAPPTGWQRTADLSLALSQTSYNDAWSGSEAGAITWTFNGNLTAERMLGESLHWKNTLKLTFGQQHTQKRSGEERRWLSPEKASDRIFFETLMLGTFGWMVDPYAAVVLESQFYDPVLAEEASAAGVPEGDLDQIDNLDRLFHPIQLTESIGLGRQFIDRENAELLTRVGFAVRQQLSRSVSGLNDAGTELRYESATVTDGGFEWVTDYSRTFGGGDLKYVTKLRVFQSLFNSESDDLEALAEELGEPDLADDWKTADLAWENTFSAAVAQYIQVSLFAELLYDKQVDRRGRFREILALGVSYKLF
ncbi:MAG: DUF3078 domain-containing protein [Candidatus Eisenbacteria bacterium]|nr:DUF3078 domain-containing protein [Candidatus Eisenbacteria bacterium]